MAQGEERAVERQAEREAAIEGITDAIIAAVTAWSRSHPEAKWDEMEEQVLRARQKFGERLMQELVEKRAGERVAPGAVCPQCGREMRYKGQKRRRVSSSLGETQISRGHYYCPECQTGVFPPG